MAPTKTDRVLALTRDILATEAQLSALRAELAALLGEAAPDARSITVTSKRVDVRGQIRAIFADGKAHSAREVITRLGMPSDAIRTALSRMASKGERELVKVPDGYRRR